MTRTVTSLYPNTHVPELHIQVAHKVQQPVTLLRTNTMPNLPSYYDNTLDQATGHYNPDYLQHLTDIDYGLIPLTRRMRLARPTPYTTKNEPNVYSIHFIIIIIIRISRFH